jgi:hypothetical protein
VHWDGILEDEDEDEDEHEHEHEQEDEDDGEHEEESPISEFTLRQTSYSRHGYCILNSCNS